MDASATTTKNKLRRNSIGLSLVVFMVISAAAPLTGVAGAIPIAMLLGNGAGIPGTVIVMTVVMLVWAVGFVALSRKIKNAGAFYAYSSRAVSGRLGGAVGLMALLTYNTVMFGLLGMLGGVAQGVFGGFGLALPWWVWSLIALALVGTLGYRQVELSARVLMILVLLEYLIALVVDAAILGAGGAGKLTFNVLDPSLMFSGAIGAAILFTFGSFIGIEATAIYSEEVRDPERNVPRATYISIVMIGAFYLLTTWLMVVATGVDDLVPTIAALPDPTDYFFSIAGQYAGGAVATIAGLLLVSSLFASVSAMHNFTARYIYVVGREGLLPASVGVTHDVHKSPHIGSLIQTVLTVIVIGLFAILGLDPILNLFAWVAQIAILGLMLMMAITSFAVIVYFRKHPEDASFLKTTLAPAVSGIFMLILALYAFFTYGEATGTSAPLSIIFPALIPLFALIGWFVASRLAANDPKRYAQLGANQWAVTDAVAVAESSPDSSAP